MLKVKFNLSRTKFKASSNKFNFTAVLNCNRAPQQKTHLRCKFLKQKTLNFIYQIFVTSQLQIFSLKFKNHSSLAALKSHIEIRLNNIHIACKLLKKVIKRKSYI